MVFGMRKKKRDTTGAAPPTAIQVSSAQDEERYLVEHPCECFGFWLLRDSEIIRADAVVHHFRRNVECSLCGNRKAFEFIGAAENFVEPEAQEVGPREQHYHFAHRVLHENFFSSPKEMLGLLSSAAGERRLRDVWNQIGSNAEDQRTVDATGVTVSPCVLAGRAGCLIRLPPPITSPEAYFVAMLPPTQADPEPRYFVLEHTSMPEELDHSPDDETPRAVLCEWLAGRKRRNHQAIISSPDERAFCAAVESQLQDEERRQRLGARAVAASTWDLPAEGDPDSVMFAGGAYRPQFCLFAFHLLPDKLAGDPSWRFSEDVTVVSRHILDLWQEAREICNRKQQSPATAEPSVRLVQVAGRPRVLVEMPEPVSPPEPAFVLLPATPGEPVILLELADHRTRQCLLTTITDQNHGIVRGVKSPDVSAFIQATEAHLARRADDDSAPDVLQHLVLYVEISKEWRD